MKYYFFRLVSFIFALYTLVSCRETFVENIIGKSQNTFLNTEFKKIQIINRVNLEDIPENISLSGSKILTLSAEEPIDVTSLGIVMEVKLSQLKNVLFSMVVTLFGIVISVKPLQP